MTEDETGNTPEQQAADRATLIRLMREATEIDRRIQTEREWLDACIVVAEQRMDAQKQQRARVHEAMERIGRQVLPKGKKSIWIPGAGTVSYRKRAETIEIKDDRALIARLERDEVAADLVRIEKRLNLDAARQYAIGWFKETGETLPGVGEYHPEDTYGYFGFKPDPGMED